jgi:prevent-host-death family protein
MEVGVRELRTNLSRWLDLVRDGNEVVITDRGRPVARLVGVSWTPAIDRLVAQGLVRLPVEPRRPAADIRRVKSKGSVSALVPDQRR